jgi:hypothetical protein
MDMYDYNYEVWQLVWQLSQSKEKYRIELEKERKEHQKTKIQLNSLKNNLFKSKNTNPKLEKLWNKLFN